MIEAMVTLSGWILIALITLAPWALACQPPRMAAGLVVGIVCAAAFRLMGLRARRFVVSRLAVGTVIWLLAYGWYGVTRSGAVAAATHTPAGDVRAVTRTEMVFLSAVAIAGLLAADLCRADGWRRRFGVALVATAAGVAGLGTAEHLGMHGPYARFMSGQEGFPFGPFNYHANAGSFLNLALPLAVMACGSGVAPVIATAVLLVGIGVNVSRASQVVAAIELAACVTAWWMIRPRSAGDPGLRRASAAGLGSSRRLRQLAIAGGIVLAVAVVAMGARQSVHRWSKISAALSPDGSRPTLWRVCWGMAKSAGWRGDGPGTFKLLFPHTPNMDPMLYYRFIVQEYHPGERVSMWNHVHDDYLQSLIEWGWPGTALWGVLLIGGVTVAARRDRGSVAVAIALAGVLLHAVVDFPLQVEVIRLDVAILLGLAWSRAAPAN